MFYITKEVAARLGVRRETVGVTARRLGITPVLKTPRGAVYSEEQVLQMERAIRNKDGMTVTEICQKYGLERWMVHRAFAKRKAIRPLGKRGFSPVYDPEDVGVVAKLAGW